MFQLVHRSVLTVGIVITYAKDCGTGGPPVHAHCAGALCAGTKFGTKKRSRHISIDMAGISTWQGSGPDWRTSDPERPQTVTQTHQIQVGQWKAGPSWLMLPLHAAYSRLQVRQAAPSAKSNHAQGRLHRSRASTAAKPDALQCTAAHLPPAAPRRGIPTDLPQHCTHHAPMPAVQSGRPRRMDDMDSSAYRAAPGGDMPGSEPSQ